MLSKDNISAAAKFANYTYIRASARVCVCPSGGAAVIGSFHWMQSIFSIVRQYWLEIK